MLQFPLPHGVTQKNALLLERLRFALLERLRFALL
jgi:hypothetical protein